MNLVRFSLFIIILFYYRCPPAAWEYHESLEDYILSDDNSEIMYRIKEFESIDYYLNGTEERNINWKTYIFNVDTSQTTELNTNIPNGAYLKYYMKNENYFIYMSDNSYYIEEINGNSNEMLMIPAYDLFYGVGTGGYEQSCSSITGIGVTIRDFQIYDVIPSYDGKSIAILSHDLPNCNYVEFTIDFIDKNMNPIGNQATHQITYDYSQHLPDVSNPDYEPLFFEYIRWQWTTSNELIITGFSNSYSFIPGQSPVITTSPSSFNQKTSSSKCLHSGQNIVIEYDENTHNISNISYDDPPFSDRLWFANCL